MSVTENPLDVSIINSPFYKDGRSSLPNSSPVEPGKLYMMDDAGGVVYQVFADSANSPTGTLDIEGKKEAVINNIGNSLYARSYKSGASPDKQPAAFPFSMSITNLIPSGRAPLDISRCEFKVAIGENDFFYVYDVHGDNGQVVLVHDVPVQVLGKNVNTEVRGLVFVQYQNKVYIGFPEPTEVAIEDPNGDFHESVAALKR